MTRPVRGPLNTTTTDHVTDAYDTIDWLVKNTPESNGRVGMIGSSYEGFTVVMALLGPHPALKVAAPESPMVDGWMGDDWFHYGAFRQPNFDYTSGQTTKQGEGEPSRAEPMTITRLFGGRARPATMRGSWARSIAVGGEDDGASRLRRILARTGARQAGGGASVAGADDVDSRTVGPGGYVGRDSLLPGAQGQGPGRSQLSRDGALAAQPSQLRRIQSGSAELGWRHGIYSFAAMC